MFDPTQTDRTDTGVRAELRYKWSKDVRASAGYEETRSEFVTSPQRYDNRTRAILGGIFYDHSKLALHVLGGYRELDTDPRIDRRSLLRGDGLVLRLVHARPPGRPLAFASRNLSYGLSSPYYVSTRYGGGVVVRAGWRLKLQGFASSGTRRLLHALRRSGGAPVDRRDDVRSYGGGLEFFFTSRIQVKFVGTEDTYTSNVPGNDRSFFRWFVSLNLGGNLLQ